MSARLNSSISARIITFAYYYACCIGVITYGIKSKTRHAHYKLTERPCYKYFAIALRSCCVIFILYDGILLSLLDPDRFFSNLSLIMLVVSVFCSSGIIFIQLRQSSHFLWVTNALLRLQRRTAKLTLGPSAFELFGAHQLLLILLKLYCLVFELGIELPKLFFERSFYALLTDIFDVYLTVGICMVIHVSFLTYLSIGALYRRMNTFMRDDFCPRLARLDAEVRQQNAYERKMAPGMNQKLQSLIRELDECTAIYDEIYRVGRRFHWLVEVHVLYTILFSFSGLAMMMYSFIFRLATCGDFSWLCIFFALKICLDVFTLTMAAHSAASGCEVAKGLSLESVAANLCDNIELETSIQIFFNRLNLQDFKLNLLGLFELSNDMNLMFLSGIATCLTYIIQRALSDVK